MRISSGTSVGLVLSGAALSVGGYFAFKRYKFRESLLAEIDCIPWEILEPYIQIQTLAQEEATYRQVTKS